jgi:hypothetical protein
MESCCSFYKKVVVVLPLSKYVQKRSKRFYGIDTYRSCSNLVHTDEARMTSRSVEQKQSTHVRVF